MKVDPRVVGSSEQDEILVEEEDLIIRGLPGDKLLHRLAARRLGLVEVAGRAKRAMQFGSRSARMEGGEGTKKIKGDAMLAS